METTFVSSKTIAQIKAEQSGSPFQIMKGGDGKSNWWRCGAASGPVSKKGYATDPILSETPEGVFILHSSGGEVLDTL
jgi:hypothetical protein